MLSTEIATLGIGFPALLRTTPSIAPTVACGRPTAAQHGTSIAINGEWKRTKITMLTGDVTDLRNLHTTVGSPKTGVKPKKILEARLQPAGVELVSNWSGKFRQLVARTAADCRAVRVKCDEMSELPGKSDTPDKREVATPPRPIHSIWRLLTRRSRDVRDARTVGAMLQHGSESLHHASARRLENGARGSDESFDQRQCGIGDLSPAAVGS
jgi:hypothetical protein